MATIDAIVNGTSDLVDLVLASIRYLPPPVALAIQLINLRGRNTHGHGRVNGGELTWQFNAKPTPVSRKYRLRLGYTLQGPPEVFVLDPGVRALGEGHTIPDLFDQKRARLCLYLPKSNEWHRRRLLAGTLVHWSVLWLFHFEEWLISGEWRGGGVHVDVANELHDVG